MGRGCRAKDSWRRWASVTSSWKEMDVKPQPPLELQSFSSSLPPPIFCSTNGGRGACDTPVVQGTSPLTQTQRWECGFSTGTLIDRILKGWHLGRPCGCFFCNSNAVFLLGARQGGDLQKIETAAPPPSFFYKEKSKVYRFSCVCVCLLKSWILQWAVVVLPCSWKEKQPCLLFVRTKDAISVFSLSDI